MKRIFGVLNRFIKSPLSFIKFLLKRMICSVRSKYYSLRIDEGGGKIVFTEPFMKFKIRKHKTAKLHVKGNLRITPHVGGEGQSVIYMGENTNFQINGDFAIGQSVRFFLSNNSTLTIGGKSKESGSGITADTLVMVSKKITIGKDFLCAWNVFISDSDWHTIDGQNHQSDVIIGDHVWIANNSSVLKGSVIRGNSIVASHSKVINKEFPESVMIAGTPAKIVKTSVNWSRDI